MTAFDPFRTPRSYLRLEMSIGLGVRWPCVEPRPRTKRCFEQPRGSASDNLPREHAVTDQIPPTVILVVDDDPFIQDLIQVALEEASYAVVVVGNGKDGQAALERDASTLGGLITDVNLGSEPNGWKVAARARELNANLPVIYMSGDSAHEWAAHGVPNSIMISKPFAPIEVVVALATLRNQSVIAAPAA